MHVSEAEVADAIKNLKRGKSSESDGLTGEPFIYSKTSHCIIFRFYVNAYT